MNPEINVVWWKRDLRVSDHAPLKYAIDDGLPILLLYCFEPSIVRADDSSERHWRFVYQSIQNLRNGSVHPISIQIAFAEVYDVFEWIKKQYTIVNVFSHQETGNALTFKRDVKIGKWFCQNNIDWKEFQQQAVWRKLESRKDWDERWEKFVSSDLQHPDWSKSISFVNLNFPDNWREENLPLAIRSSHPDFQPGGESFAWKYFKSFLETRYTEYSRFISKPLLSRKSCSRLSPYIAYGNISIREVIQETEKKYTTSAHKRSLQNFLSRLKWHCHFIQKFESECSMEFQPVNTAFQGLYKERKLDLIQAWQEGRTGVPLIDACMRCVNRTGYLNFRMRAMVVSFFTFNLWQDWRDLHFLARQFLDYEPGIHYPQLQMQAGETGVNTIRIYNPIKNAEEHDPDGEFVKLWVPELRNIPVPHIFKPWEMTTLEQQLYGCLIGVDYPAPIVDLEESRKYASDQIWKIRKSELVESENKRIRSIHIRPTS